MLSDFGQESEKIYYNTILGHPKNLRRRNVMSTIAAISTAPGIGGIGIIRMSGENCFDILDKIFVPKNKTEIKGYTMKYGKLINPKLGEFIDEVIVSYFVAPKSYTKENMCEINSHGGICVMNRILELCIENGASLAEPGEFTKRAFLNGRIDLSQAEAVIDMINAKTDSEMKAASNQLEGGLSEKIKKIRDIGISLMSDIEASIDYPEYDVEEVTNAKLLQKLSEMEKLLEALEEHFESGKIIKEGIKTAIIGKPNSGKSSLLNAMLREDRAIVSNIEGTTRDTIEEYVSVKGIPLKIIDTAGIRSAENEIEKIGIEKSKKVANEADLIIAIFDGSKPLTEDDENILDLIKDKNAIIVINKQDLGENKQTVAKLEIGKNTVKISALTKENIEKLYEEIAILYSFDKIKIEAVDSVTNIRHKTAIKNAKNNIEEAVKTATDKMPIDIIAIQIKEALENLGEITGDNISDSIIQDIFSKFCLGK